jgi:hypothetical protein
LAKPNWKPLVGSGDGVVIIRLRRWNQFAPFLETNEWTNGRGSQFVWRGQADADWSLSTSLDRLVERLQKERGEELADLEELAGEHLAAFKYAIRGRRGSNPAPLNDDSLWAIGQHYGLATPLLDWTRSPFAAAYFAFEPPPREARTKYRSVFALNRKLVALRTSGFKPGDAKVEFIDPLIDDNPRLVSQGGLFTRAPLGVPVEYWIQQVFEGSDSVALIKLEIPAGARSECLRNLDQMNLNHTSLFPDLIGASLATNLKLELDR